MKTTAQTFPDVMASEWLKLRSVRSTYWLPAAMLLVFAAGCLISSLMTSAWDNAPAAQQAHFESADSSVVVLPFVQFCLATLGALAITSEYGTGMMRSSLVAVPRRRRVLAGKAVVVGALALLAGQVLAFLTLFAVELIVGDRPAPIAPWPSLADGVPYAFCSGLVVMVIALVGLGLGVIIRSSAGTLVTIAALLFVLPTVAYLLPSPWGERFYWVLLPNLAPQLAGKEGLLSPVGAVGVLAAYLVVTLGAAAVVLSRRDA